MTEAVFFELVKDQLVKVEEKMLAQTDGRHESQRMALQHLLSSGGKRIRPAVALLTGRMLDGDPDMMITLAAALEMLHTATLVHDDLIDGALLRRGLPTLNAEWTAGATVLTGDFLFARAARLAAETNSIKLMHLFADTLTVIVNGELIQMFTARGMASRKDYERRIYAKTASLFEAATKTAAMICEAEDGVQEKVRRYGYEIGMAFQIVDDILDFTGQQATVGKPVASDLRQGLVTLPVLCYLEAHPDDTTLQTVLSCPECDEELLQQLLDSIRNSGAAEQALDEARQYVARGIQSLQGLPDGPEHRALVDLAEFIVHREL